MKGKNIFNTAVHNGKKEIIFFSILCMLTGLFFSRAVLSVSMISFIILAFTHKNITGHFRRFLSEPVLWGMSILFFIPFISGLWSSNQEVWRDMMQIKLPLIFLPLAFAGDLRQTSKDWQRIAYFFILLVAGGTAWSILQYLSDYKAVHEGYLRAKTIMTPLGDDHVRFSWLVSFSVFLCARLILKNKNRRIHLLTIITGIWLILYLHILAVRTGLLCLYVMSFCGVLIFVFRQRNYIRGIALTALILMLPVASWFIFPTFQNKIKYVVYDVTHLSKNEYLPGTSDGGRMVSIKAGLNIIAKDPLKGVGFGDIRDETIKWYATHYPGMPEKDKIYPSSEWLMYGAGSGWPGMIFFSLILLLLLFSSKDVWWRLLNIITMLGLIFDIGLEVQFGVFLFSFILLWWHSWTLSEH